MFSVRTSRPVLYVCKLFFFCNDWTTLFKDNVNFKGVDVLKEIRESEPVGTMSANDRQITNRNPSTGPVISDSNHLFHDCPKKYFSIIFHQSIFICDLNHLWKSLQAPNKNQFLLFLWVFFPLPLKFKILFQIQISDFVSVTSEIIELKNKHILSHFPKILLNFD